MKNVLMPLVNRYRLWRTAGKVKRFKDERFRKALPYHESPDVSVVILSFNHRQNVKVIAERLRMSSAEEIIVCEDGSVDGSLQEWAKYLNRPNDFIVRSNDLHEIRAYDRALSLARGEVVILCQDDQIPPANNIWLEQATTLFRKLPRLDVLGGQGAFEGFEVNWENGHLVGHFEVPDTRVAGVRFFYAPMINGGPIFIRRKALEDLGGLDFGYSPVGWPGIHFDHEISLRTWLNGGLVGWYRCPFQRNVGGRGTLMFGHAGKRVEQARKNYLKLRDAYGKNYQEIEKHVAEANRSLQRTRT